MFTGIVQEIGAIRRIEARAGAGGAEDRRIEVAFATIARERLEPGRQHLRGRRVPHRGGARRVAAFMPTSRAKRCASRRWAPRRDGARVNLEPALRAGDASAVTGCPDMSMALPRCSSTANDARSLRVEFAAPQAAGALHRAQGLGDARWREPHGQRSGRREVRRQSHSAHARSHHARRARQRARASISKSTCWRATSSGSHGNPMKPLNSIEEILADIAAGRMVVIMDDEDRENEGDLIMAAQKVRARGHQLHGALRPRPHLPDADRRTLPPAAAAAHGQRDASRTSHQLHAVHRSGRRRHHRHLRARSRAHGHHRGEAECASRGSAPARTHLSGDGAARWRAHARRSHRGGLRSRAARGARSFRGDRRDHERRRHHGAPSGSRSVRATARPQDRHDRRPDPLPPAPGALGGAHRRAGRWQTEFGEFRC